MFFVKDIAFNLLVRAWHGILPSKYVHKCMPAIAPSCAARHARRPLTAKGVCVRLERPKKRKLRDIGEWKPSDNNGIRFSVVHFGDLVQTCMRQGEREPEG